MTDKEKEELNNIEKWTRSMGLLKEANLLRKFLNLIEKQEKVLNDIKQEVFNYNESIKLNDTLNNDNFRSAYVIIKKIENYLKEVK